MKSIVLKRILAFLIDWVIILIYAFLLFVVVNFFRENSDSNILISPLRGQLVGFLSLTVPAILYFVLSENSVLQATTGKRILGLKVTNISDEKASASQLLIRNLLKLGPWEIAHFGVHWLMYYTNQNLDPPNWVMLVLIIAQLLVLIYFAWIFSNSDKRTIYELASGTKVKMVGN